MNNRLACIALNMISGIGYAKYSALVRAFEEPGKVFAASFDELLAVKGIGEMLANKIANYQNEIDLESELELAERSGVQIVTILDSDYPPELLSIYDPPLCLYIRGVLPSFTNNAIAIVGSRKMSKYGERMTKVITEGAVFHNYIVVSGLAYGVDYVAHKTVVDNDGITVAVLGGGLAKVQPKEHIPLARDIISKGGAIISEFPLNFPVSRTSFPRRNRIVAALSQGVIVTEAGLDSGAMITANIALDYGKEVFAVPGNADNPQAKGCHKLIRNGQATLIENFNDVLQVMDVGLFNLSELCEQTAPFQDDLADSLNEHERLIVNNLSDGDKYFDDLVLNTQIETGILLGSLIALELKMIIIKNPDKSYRLRTK